MDANETTRRPLVELACGLALVAAFAFGIAAPTNPELDGIFALEPYRQLGWAPFVAAATLLLAVLLFPRVAVALERLAAGVVARVPSRARTPLLVAALFGLFLTFTDRSLSGDAVGVIMNACRGIASPSNALNSMIQIGLVRAVDVDPHGVVVAISCAAGALFVALAVAMGRLLFSGAGDRVAATALLLTSGSATIFFGNVEMYPPVVAVLLLYLLLGVRRLAGADLRPWPAFALGVLATLHGSALVLLPSLAYLVWFAPRARRTLRAVIAWSAAFAAPIALVAAVLVLGFWGGAAPDAPAERYGNALGALGQRPFLPPFLSPTNVGYRYAVLDPEHLVGVLNLVFMTCPLGFLLLAAGRRRDPRRGFVLLVGLALVALACVWNVTYPLRRDWDLFATIGVPLALLGALRYLGGPAAPGRTARIVAMGLFCVVPLVVSNTGDRVQRRAYAESMTWAYERALLPESPIPDAMRPRVERHLDSWRDEVGRLDVHGTKPKMATAWEAVRVGDNETALRVTGEVLADEPRNFEATLARGEALFYLRRLEESRVTLERALVVAREDMRPQARRFLAQMDLDAGRMDEAVRHLERGLREEMAWPSEALALLEMLAAVRRAQGRDDIAVVLDRIAERRRATGLK